jgi:hypothetical protein
MEADRELVGPGDNPTVRLINAMNVDTAPLMRLEDGSSSTVLQLDVRSRAMAEDEPVEDRCYFMDRQQAVWLMRELALKLTEHWS